MTEIAEAEQLQEPEDADARPAGLPANYKSVEALANSYREAEKKLNQLFQENHDLKETLDTVLKAQQFEPGVYEPPAVPVALAARQPFDHLEMLGRLANEAARNAVRNLPPIGDTNPAAVAHQAQVDDLIAADPELRTSWPQLAPVVAARIAENPALLPDKALDDPRATVVALKGIARHVQLGRLHELGTLEREIAATSQRLMKINAQTATGTGGRPQIAEESDEDFAQSLIAAHASGYASRMASRLSN